MYKLSSYTVHWTLVSFKCLPSLGSSTSVSGVSDCLCRLYLANRSSRGSSPEQRVNLPFEFRYYNKTWSLYKQAHILQYSQVNELYLYNIITIAVRTTCILTSVTCTACSRPPLFITAAQCWYALGQLLINKFKCCNLYKALGMYMYMY